MRRRLCVALLSLGLFAAGCGGGDDGSPTSPTPTPPQGPADLVIQNLVVGEGDEASGTRAVAVHYTLWLYDPLGTDSKGTRLQSSRDNNGQPYAFRLGTNSVIRGFEQGVTGMRVGGVRRVIIPPSLGYGSAGSPPSIPGNSWIVFELELMAVAD